MLKIRTTLRFTFVIILLLLVGILWALRDPAPDYLQSRVNLNDPIWLSAVQTENTTLGSFKSSFKIQLPAWPVDRKIFFGQELLFKDNPQIDSLFIGVTSQLISRVELWKAGKLIDSRELGFMSKLESDEKQTLSIDFRNQTNQKCPGKSRISMRFYSGTGIFGDIGTIHYDLSPFSDLSGDKAIRVFSKSLDAVTTITPQFSDLSIWKNYQSFD